MWLLGGVLLFVFIGLGIVEGTIEVSSGKEAASGLNVITSILNIVVSVVFGVNGNKWREKILLSRGYEYQDTVDAQNPEAAIASWFKDTKSD